MRKKAANTKKLQQKCSYEKLFYLRLLAKLKSHLIHFTVNLFKIIYQFCFSCI